MSRPSRWSPSHDEPGNRSVSPRHMLDGPGAGGRWLVAALVALGVAAAVVGVWFQRQQTRLCLQFYGVASARLIAAAPRVELLRVRSGSRPGQLVATTVRDVSAAAGLVHLRRGLVEDANFIWTEGALPGGGGTTAGIPLPPERWDFALRFSGPAAGESATLVMDVDEPSGGLAVVGRPGKIGLGRIRSGLKVWLEEQCAGGGPARRAADRAGETGLQSR